MQELETAQESLSDSFSEKKKEFCQLQADIDSLSSDMERLQNEKRWVRTSSPLQHLRQTEPAASSAASSVPAPSWAGCADTAAHSLGTF